MTTVKSSYSACVTFSPGITIYPDGRVVIPEDLTLDEAAQAFWKAVEGAGLIKRSGHVLVPIKPTREMLLAACIKINEEQARRIPIHLSDAADIWNTMISVATKEN